MSSPNIEKLILQQLMCSQEYTRRVLPFLKDEYFQDPGDKLVFSIASEHFQKYNSLPTKTEIEVELSGQINVPAKNIQAANNTLAEVTGLSETPDLAWMIDHSEKFCQDRSLFIAMTKAIEILDTTGKASGSLSKTAIPTLMTEALSVSFDKHIGHDYFEDANDRFDFYNRVEKRIPFGLDYLNRITGGGVTPKTLNVVMAGTGVGKSLMLCDHAASCLRSGYKVLYITCEMAEEKISERIDANLLDVDINCISQLAKSQFLKGIIDFQAKTEGRLVVKEYPTATANAMHFRSLLNELRLKKDFKPDVIFIDYLNICASVRYKPGANVNSYTYIKAIAEELRGLAIEADVPIFTATQSNRQGFSSSDPELGDTSESFGLPATADLFLVMVTSEELDEKNQIMFKQLKNRYNDLAKYRKFLVGINRSKMQLYDLEESAQDGLIDTAQDVRNTREYGDPSEGLGETSWDADKKTAGSFGKKPAGGGKFDSWKF